MTNNETEIREWDPEWLVRRGNYLTIITPALATELLERNRNNRKLKRRAIAQYARDMASGDWNPDASDIKFNRAGDLIDGQNRLWACVQAGVPFPTLVRTGLSSDARDAVDTGVRRTVADSFRMGNVAYASDLSAALNLRYRYETLVRTRDGKVVQNFDNLTLTTAEAHDYLNRHQAHGKYAELAVKMWGVGPSIPKSVFIAGLGWFAESSESKAVEFAESFIDGRVTGTGDPLLALSRYAAQTQRMKSGSPGNRGRVTAVRHLLALVMAWNAFIAAEPLPRIYLAPTAPLVEPV